MVCIRCKMVVKDELAKLELPYKTVELGEIEFSENISATKLEELDALVNEINLKFNRFKVECRF